MTKKRSSITFTVFAGYLVLATLAGFAVWFVYNQVVTYTRMTTMSNTGNEKLLLVGEAATKLYEAESLSRQLIQEGDLQGLDSFASKIDSIKTTLASLEAYSPDNSLEQEVDSINVLLTEKSENLKELLELRATGETESYYSRVLQELTKVDETFDDPEYEQRFKELEPHQRNVLIKLLEYSRSENPANTSLTADSLITAVKSVLSELEVQERQYRRALREKEDELLTNDMKLNSRLRSLLSTIETEERYKSLQQVNRWQETVEKTSKTIATLGAVSLLVILLFIFLVIRDVSRSQRYRLQLERAKSYAESLLKSREQFMNTVTHDLRSPLNSIVGYTGLLDKTNLDKSQYRYIVQLKKASDFLLHLVNDLLDLSRLEAGKMAVEELSFNGKNLIEETVENAVPPDKPSAVELKKEVAPELDTTIVTDPFRIKQILTNLVSNAFKFTERGQVVVRARLDQDEWLHIEVADTGKGISKAQKEKVFEEFSQEDTSIEKKFGGSGLGLAISKKLTDLLGGRISLESKPGEGSTFTVAIPVKTSKAPEETKEPVKIETANLKKYSVLLVDDEPAQLGLLKELFRSTGMKYRTAKDGKEALEILRTTKTDIILTDIQMPQMNGIELLEAIKSDPKISTIPVVALSGQPNVSSQAYLKMGFHASLLKPYSSEELLQIVGEVLRVKFEKKPYDVLPSADPIKGYTLSEIKTFAGQDQQALNAIIRAFIESTENNLRALQKAFREGDFSSVSAIAHKMLPMFRQMGAQELIVELEILEKGETVALEKYEIASLTKAVEKLLKALEQEIKA